MEHANATLDANWRWVHGVQCSGEGPYQQCSSSGNCYTGTTWDNQLCPDPETCAQSCALEGVTSQEYASTYGVKPIPGGVELGFVTGSNVGSRLYLTDNERSYKMFKLKNREFSFDVDVSALPCGLNGAVYFSEMEADGGFGGGNQAGAKYGTGYCDAQCPHDVKFVSGEANIMEWDQERALGSKGACCTEMDIWEANSQATAFTAHPCSVERTHVCEGRDCGGLPGDQAARYDGVCDKDGCDFNSFRMGDKTFFGKGPGFAVDTSKPITVVTQWITDDGTDAGDLSEIRRLYLQDGKVIQNSHSEILPGRDQHDTSLSEDFCEAQKETFQDKDDFRRKGGLKRVGEALDRGMVLVLSLWDDSLTKMTWLDSSAGEGGVSKPGVLRGPCEVESGSPEEVRAKYASASVKYTNFMYGELDSTYTEKARASTPSSRSAGPPAQLAAPEDWPRSPMPAAVAPASTESGDSEDYRVHSAKMDAWARQPAPLQELGSERSTQGHMASRAGGQAKAYQQCGGKQWTGPHTCETGCRCEQHGEYYSQCTPPAGAYKCSMSGQSAPSASAPTFVGGQESLRFLVTEDETSGAPRLAQGVAGSSSRNLSNVVWGAGAVAFALVSMAATVAAWRQPQHFQRREQPPSEGLLGVESRLLQVSGHEAA